MPETHIYHNPHCSKSRAALALLKERGVRAVIIDYLACPPTPEALDAVCAALGMPPWALIRTKEPRFHELGLSLRDDRTRDAWLRLLCENPILIERPIVLFGHRATIGRPIEKIVELLNMPEA